MCFPDMDIPDIGVSLPFIWNGVKYSLSNSRCLVWKISSGGSISRVIAPSSPTISWAKPWLFQSAERVVFKPQIRIWSKCLLKVAQFSCFSHDVSAQEQKNGKTMACLYCVLNIHRLPSCVKMISLTWEVNLQTIFELTILNDGVSTCIWCTYQYYIQYAVCYWMSLSKFSLEAVLHHAVRNLLAYLVHGNNFEKKH